MKQEIPSAPSAKEEPEFASRIQEVRGIAQGKRPRQKSRKARQGRSLRAQDNDGNVSASAKSGSGFAETGSGVVANGTKGMEESMSFSPQASYVDEADVLDWDVNAGAVLSSSRNRADDSSKVVCGDFDRGDMAESWDELFGLVDKECDRPLSNIRFLDALKGFKESGFARNGIGEGHGHGPFAAKSKHRESSQDEIDSDVCPNAAADQGAHINDVNVFDSKANENGQRCMGNNAQKDNERSARQEQERSRRHSGLQHPTSHVRPPQKRKRVYVTQQAPAQGIGLSKLVAISASTSLLVSVVIAFATGAIEPDAALACIAGWSM